MRLSGRIFNSLFLLFALIAATRSASALGPQIATSLENNNGQLRLTLINNSAMEFRGTVRIGLGNDVDQKEVGQLTFTLSSQELRLLKLVSVSPYGTHYSLKIYDERNSLVLYRMSPLRSINDSTPEIPVKLEPVPAAKNRVTTPIAAPVENQPPAVAPEKPLNEAAKPGDEIQVQARLLAGEGATDAYSIAFEITSPQPVSAATLSIDCGKFKDSKPANINRQAAIEFKLPDELEEERIGYQLTGKDGRILAKGEMSLTQLMAEDSVTVTDIRTDRQSYDPGETAKITVLLEGKSPRGYRLEINIRDGGGNLSVQDQRTGGSDKNTASHEFSVTIPRDAVGPLTFEFKIFDGQNSQLFDSGERDIPLNEAKNPRKPAS